MIIDLHTQVWSSPDQLGREPAQRLRAWIADHRLSPDASPVAHERATAGIDGSVVIGYRSELLGARIPNEMIVEFVGQNPTRRVGVAGIDPLAGDALEQVAAAADAGMIGVSVSPACQGFHPAHTRAMRVYDACVARKMALFVLTQPPLTASATLELSQPAGWDEAARAFASLPIVIAGLGWPWIDQTLALIAKHRQVFADLSGVGSRSWQLYSALLTAANLGVMDKLLLGSGFPFDTPARVIERIYSVNAFSLGTQLPTVPRTALRSLIERDGLACVGFAGRITPIHPALDDSIEDSEEEPVAAARRGGDWRRELDEDEDDHAG
jgi:hypothetical protein